MKKLNLTLNSLLFCAGLHGQSCLTDTTTWRVTPTADNATIIIPTSSMPRLNNNTALPNGTLIGAFNGAEQLCGFAVWTGSQNIALTVYGFEQGGRGFTAGEQIRFRVKLPNNILLISIQANYSTGGIYTSQGNYNPDAIMGLTSFVATYPTALLGNVSLTQISCHGGLGSLAAIPSGGTPPYRYNWTGTRTDSVLNNVPTGNYRLEITDSRNCKAIVDTVLRQPDSLRMLDTIMNVPCYGRSEGQIRLGATGGVQPYNYTWSTGNGRNLSAGVYRVTLTDGNNCIRLASFTVTQPDSLRLTTTSQPSVVNGATGTASVQVTGGTPSYRYVWTRGDTTAQIQNLAPNTYTVTVTDRNGCTKTAIISIITNALQGALSAQTSIKAYPNPVLGGSGQLHVRVQNPLQLEITFELYDVLGKMVKSIGTVRQMEVELSLDLNEVVSGSYVLRARSGGLTSVQNIVIF
jgi:hypothetical protein